MRWGLGVLCLAACGGGTGVDLEIRSEVPIASVEIFFANRPCTEQDGRTPCREQMGWIDGQLPVAGEIYETHNAEFDKNKFEPLLAPVASNDGATYTVRLIAEGEIGAPSLIALVGLDGAGKAVALAVIDDEIPEHTAEHWVVTLAATDPASAAQNAPTGNDTDRRAAVWGRDGTPDQQAGSRCLVMQEWTGDEWKSKFIVPASDHDCDGVLPDLECDEQYFHLNEQRPAACAAVADASGTTSDGACTIGVSTCRDGTTQNAKTCLLPERAGATHTCVPDKVCEACDSPYGLVPCVQSLMQDTSGLGFATCRLYGGAGGVACGPGQAGSQARLRLPFSSCNFVELRPVSMPLVASQATEIMQHQAKIGVLLTDPASCTLDVYLKSGTVPLGGQEWILVAVYTPNNAVMLIPVKINFPSNATDCEGGLMTDECGVSLLVGDSIGNCGYLTP